MYSFNPFILFYNTLEIMSRSNSNKSMTENLSKNRSNQASVISYSHEQIISNLDCANDLVVNKSTTNNIKEVLL